MTNKITSIIYWPFEYFSFACSYSKHEQKSVQSAQLCLVYVCVRMSVCVPALALHFLSLSLSEFIPYFTYVYCLSPKFNKQCKIRASEKRCLMTLVCWILLSNPVARRAPVSVSPSCVVEHPLFTGNKDLVQVTFSSRWRGLFLQDKQWLES